MWARSTGKLHVHISACPDLREGSSFIQTYFLGFSRSWATSLSWCAGHVFCVFFFPLYPWSNRNISSLFKSPASPELIYPPWETIWWFAEVPDSLWVGSCCRAGGGLQGLPRSTVMTPYSCTAHCCNYRGSWGSPRVEFATSPCHLLCECILLFFSLVSMLINATVPSRVSLSCSASFLSTLGKWCSFSAEKWSRWSGVQRADPHL